MKYLFNLGCVLIPEHLKIAFRHQNVDMLEWLLENECPCDASVTKCVIKMANYDLLQWLLKNDCQWDNECIEALFENKCYYDEGKTLIQIISKGYTLPESTYSLMVKHNWDKNVIQKIIDAGCPITFFEWCAWKLMF